MSQTRKASVLVRSACTVVGIGGLLLLPWTLAAQAPIVIDRVVAVVDGVAITLSEVDSARELAQLRVVPGSKNPAVTRETALNQLIEQLLTRRDIESFPGLEVTPAQVQEQMNVLAARYAADGGLAAMATKWNLTVRGIEEDVRYQLRVQAFVDLRFMSFVSIENADIEAYYRDKLPEQLRQEGVSQIPPLESVRQQIHDLLAEQRVHEELNRWIDDLKSKADITYFAEALRLLPATLEKSYVVSPRYPRTESRPPGTGGPR